MYSPGTQTHVLVDLVDELLGVGDSELEISGLAGDDPWRSSDSPIASTYPPTDHPRSIVSFHPDVSSSGSRPIPGPRAGADTGHPSHSGKPRGALPVRSSARRMFSESSCPLDKDVQRSAVLPLSNIGRIVDSASEYITHLLLDLQLHLLLALVHVWRELRDS